MKDFRQSGLLVVGHGSRREEANVDMRNAAELIGERCEASLVEAAFLEIEHPTVAEGFARLVDRGAESIIVHPYFLSPGRHTRGDLPVKVGEAAARFPKIKYEITKPLSSHALVIDASVERIREKGYFQQLERKSGAARAGVVYLVGAGPGDPGLLTLRANDLLKSADTVIYDRLVNPEIRRLARPDAKQIYVGKVCGGHRTSQRGINSLLITHARNGESVVRLKGGDPFIFGRGGEEAEALRSGGIEFEIVPGISSALAAPAYAGIPLTHRGVSASVSILTGTTVEDGIDEFCISDSKVSDSDTTVILMGVNRLATVAGDLIRHGCSPETPVAVVRWGTYRQQEVLIGTLETIADEARKTGLRPPAVIVVGEVVRLRERINWFQNTEIPFRGTTAPRAVAVGANV